MASPKIRLNRTRYVDLLAVFGSALFLTANFLTLLLPERLLPTGHEKKR